MAQVRPADVERFLDAPDDRRRIVLFHGPDDGLVRERAARLTTAILGETPDPMARVSLDAAAIAADPARLADEAHAVPMFGGERVIRVNADGSKAVQASLGAVLDNPPAAAWIVLEAGELRRGTGLRQLVEKHEAGLAIACYADEGRDLDRIVDEDMAAAGLTLAADARAALKALLGADRGVSRSEIAKLTLYAAGADTVTLADVEAVVGEAARFQVDEVVDAVALGRLADADRGYRRLVAAGTAGSVVAAAAQRHFDFLARARAAYDGGQTVDAIVGAARPRIFFKREAAVKRQIAAWPGPRLERGLAILDEAILSSRRFGNIADVVVGHALLRIAAAARRPS